jgi:hypothetical protein
MPDESPRQRRSGFSIRNSPIPAENIIVIVLLTVMVAFVVFAVSGYADKAKDERYVLAAHDYFIAARAVLSEASASDSLALTPSRVNTGDEDSPTLVWSFSQLSEYVSGDRNLFRERAEELLGVEPSSSSGGDSWDLWLIGPSTATSFWEADAFLYVLRPATEDSTVDDAVVYVSFRVERVNTAGVGDFLVGFWERASYNPDAGHEVYRFDSDPLSSRA